VCDRRTRRRNRNGLRLNADLRIPSQRARNPNSLRDRFLLLPLVYWQGRLGGLERPRCRITEQLLEVGIELARIDLRNLRARWPIALADETGEHAAGRSPVDWDQRGLDGIVETPQVARVLPGRALLHELQEIGRNAGARSNE
jgi:hypothetical protein